MSEAAAAEVTPAAAVGEGTALTPVTNNAPEPGSEPPAASSSPSGDGAPNTPEVPNGQENNSDEGTALTSGSESSNVAPDEYQDFQLADDSVVNDEGLSRFKEFARGNNMPQDVAQATMDYIAKEIPGFVQDVQQHQLEAYMLKTKEWKTAYEKDPQIGGTHMRETETAAKRAINYLNDPDLVSLLDVHNPETNPAGLSLGNHRAIINLLSKFGNTLAEDTHEGGDANAGGGDKMSVSERWYG